MVDDDFAGNPIEELLGPFVGTNMGKETVPIRPACFLTALYIRMMLDR